MAYYRKCNLCGANLDPDEKCDCLEDQERTQAKREVKKEIFVFKHAYITSNKNRPMVSAH